MHILTKLLLLLSLFLFSSQQPPPHSPYTSITRKEGNDLMRRRLVLTANCRFWFDFLGRAVHYYLHNDPNRFYMVAFDDRNRIVAATADIFPGDLNHGSDVSPAARQQIQAIGAQGDHAGHVIASRLGGSGSDVLNLFPQSPHFNMGLHRSHPEDTIFRHVFSHFSNFARYTLLFLYDDNNGFPQRPINVYYHFSLEQQSGVIVEHGDGFGSESHLQCGDTPNPLPPWASTTTTTTTTAVPGHDPDILKKRQEKWEDVVQDVMKKSIEEFEENDKIAKDVYDKLKEIYPDYHIFVGIYNDVKGYDHHAIKWNNSNSVHKFHTQNKNWAVYRVQKTASTTMATEFFETKWDKIKEHYTSRRPGTIKINLGDIADYVDDTLDKQFPFILIVHHGSGLKSHYDPESVIFHNYDHGTFVIGLDEVRVFIQFGSRKSLAMKNLAEKQVLGDATPEQTHATLTPEQIKEKLAKMSGTNNPASEPTGTSTLPANTCGKRIIGYYTSWGKRWVTENQLKKLTHVIFAFIGMSEDGSIKFDGVAEDFEQGQNPAEIAERRFLDMRNKARNANSGIKILFAIGGWSNSQYFSAVSADSDKRNKFISNIAQFIKDYNIDGVDIDWEYPVTGGANEGIAADKENYVTLMKELREKLSNLQKETNRKASYVISFASAAGQWTLDPGYNLNELLKYADFVNVMTYDYYGAWGSKWGAYTGPPAPLYYSEVKGASGKMNADWTMKYYACKTKKPSQINMGLAFYGRFWENVGNAVDEAHPMFRVAKEANGKFEGGALAFRDIASSGWSLSSAQFDETVKAPYIWDSGANKFLGFENEKSLQIKVDYAIEKNVGGLMIWAIDQDSDSNVLLDLVSGASLCKNGNGNEVKHKCLPIDDIRWWTFENGGQSKQGMCGKSAPLINGYYPVCDPDDPGYACCSKAGYCGMGDDFCKCDGCVDYRKNPEKIIDEPIKPTRNVQWYLMDAPDGQRGRCGPQVPLLNGKPAICNPDDGGAHCCSNGYYCGHGDAFCKCDGCIDFKENPNHQW